MFKDTTENLWVSFINGDDNALNTIYKEFVDVLYAFGLRFTEDPDVVKDSMQDLFVDLFKYRKTLSAEVNVKAYLFTSLKRKICLVLKKAATRENHIFQLSFSLSYCTEDQLTDDGIKTEMLLKLDKQLTLLPSRQKEALYLRFNSELDYEEIAMIMDVSVGTARTLVYRGVKQLRERMVIKHLSRILA